jgi:hypothetical protein
MSAFSLTFLVNFNINGVAQLVECLFIMAKVVGSIPTNAIKSRVEPRVNYSHEIALFLQRGICLMTICSQISTISKYSSFLEGKFN